uniref:Ovule protein n=1 Tax=Haemonchus placei TaxID=6290 RepID=A0A0N4WVJ1_HAEPC
LQIRTKYSEGIVKTGAYTPTYSLHLDYQAEKCALDIAIENYTLKRMNKQQNKRSHPMKPCTELSKHPFLSLL